VPPRRRVAQIGTATWPSFTATSRKRGNLAVSRHAQKREEQDNVAAHDAEDFGSREGPGGALSGSLRSSWTTKQRKKQRRGWRAVWG
jgi:hypothetical protein